MRNPTTADRKVIDLLRLVRKPHGADAITRGAGRVLRERPSKASLIHLFGEMNAWEHELRSEAAKDQHHEELIKLGVLNTLLGAAIDATPDAPDESVADQVLAVLNDLGQAHPSEIADALGKRRPQISQVLNAMKDEGRVEIDDTVDDPDGRKVFYRPVAVADRRTRARSR